MAAFEITTLYIYRWRLVLGYGLVGLSLIVFLAFAGLYLPGGVSQAEMSSVIKADSLSLTDIGSFATQNLPYYLLQSLSITIFGVHDFSIKLPSLILGFIAAIGIIFLMSRWFRRSIAVLGSLIAITTGQFLFVAQNGTPGILYIFWPVMLLLLGTLITRGKKLQFLWKSLFFIAAALSLYTPLSIYPLLAITLAVIFHPHLRAIVRRLPKIKLTIAIVIGFVIISPLIYGIIMTPSLGLTLLGAPTEFNNLVSNIVTLGKQYIQFWKPSSTTLMTPVFGLGSVLLIAYGALHLIKTREATQSYLVIAWVICLVPILIINPAFTTVMFVPLVLLLTTGLDRLIRYWYRLFPRNPYARVAGLIPLIVLVFALVSSGLHRYAYGYYYEPQTTHNFSKDLSLLPTDTKLLVVGEQELNFYKVVENHNDKLTVLTRIPTIGTSFTATQVAKNALTQKGDYKIDRIITSVNASGADRFYVYKK